MKHPIFRSLVSSLLITFSISALSESNNKTKKNMGISLITTQEAYPDSPYSSLSSGVGFGLHWDELGDNTKLELNKGYIRSRFTYLSEKDPEVYDMDRFRQSFDVRAMYIKPLSYLADNNYLMSFHTRFEGHYNSQQLEEFENLLVGGLSFRREIESSNLFNVDVTLAGAYNFEEKDDDWPREELGHGTDVLGRQGFGYFFELGSHYTFSHSGVNLNFVYSRYDGLWGYSDDQFYTMDRITASLVVPLADENNIFRVVTSYIKRDYEIDLIGFKDVLHRMGFEYVHYF